MSSALNHFLKTAGDNVDSLSLSDASCYVLAISKFMKSYVQENNAGIELSSPDFIGLSEEKKLNDFLAKLVEVFASAKPSTYLYSSCLVDKHELQDFTDQSVENYSRLIESSEIHSRQVKDYQLKLHENLMKLVGN